MFAPSQNRSTTPSEGFDDPPGVVTITSLTNLVPQVLMTGTQGTKHRKTNVTVDTTQLNSVSAQRDAEFNDSETSSLPAVGWRDSNPSMSDNAELFSFLRGGIRSNDDFGSIGYSYEHTSSNASSVILPSPSVPGCSQTDPRSSTHMNTAESPGAQTLASLTEEALRDIHCSKKKKNNPTQLKKSHRVVRRSGKTMREEHFEGMAWTRTFVSGPMDPKWNPYKFYCQVCKGSVSLYGKGAR